MRRKKSDKKEIWIKKFGLPEKDAEIVEHLGDRIPSVERIIDESWNKIPADKKEKEYVRNHFCESVIILEKLAHSTYLHYEKEAFLYVIDRWIKENKSILDKLINGSKDQLDIVKNICQILFPYFGALHVKASQMRRSRGGKSFENIIRFLLNHIGIKCQKPSGKEPRKMLKRIDVVIPDQEAAISTPDRAFFLSCKRTLRERWKQTIPERRPLWRVFLLTIDDELSEAKANEIEQLGIIAYIRDELKEQKHLAHKGWIRRLSDLPHDLSTT
jgi:hypothetical protein